MKSIILGLFLISTVAQGSVANWKQMKEDDGIKVFKKDIPNSKIVAFKGEAIINASAGKIVHVLKDNSHRKEWVDRLVHTTVLEKTHENESIMYQEFNAPWPVSNRDFVYKATMTRNKDGVITLHMNSVDHPNAPKTVGVRADLIKSLYILTPMGENKTKLEVEIQSDPKGLLPNWVVYLIQKSWPLKTLKAIQKQVQKPFIRDIPLPPVQG